MKRFVKIVLVVVITVVALDLIVSSTLSQFDAKTRATLLATTLRELPPGASDSEMEKFMKRHTARFARDDQYHNEYSGYVEQSRVDRFLFDRKVQVVLKFSNGNTFERADVHVYYTGL
jgi:hypothetical protein